jgi:hypothetical protein
MNGVRRKDTAYHCQRENLLFCFFRSYDPCSALSLCADLFSARACTRTGAIRIIVCFYFLYIGGTGTAVWKKAYRNGGITSRDRRRVINNRYPCQNCIQRGRVKEVNTSWTSPQKWEMWQDWVSLSGWLYLVEGLSCIPVIEFGHDETCIFKPVQGIPDGSWREPDSPDHVAKCPGFPVPKKGKYFLC